MSSSILEEAAAGDAYIQPWTVEQYHWAIENGFLEESSTFELLDGFIVRKNRAKAGEDIMTVGDRHRIVVTRLAHLAPQFESLGCFLQSQQPVALPPYNEPEPDASIVRGRLDDHMNAPPGPADISCIIEVADSSLRRDLGPKLRQYASNAVPQYVVVDLASNLVLDHRTPEGDGYKVVRSLGKGETLDVTTFGGNPVSISVDRLLP